MIVLPAAVEARASARLGVAIKGVIVERAADSSWIGLVAGGILALLAPAASIALGIDPNWLAGSNDVWSAAHLSAVHLSGFDALPAVLATQAVIFCGAALAWRIAERFGPSLPGLGDLRARRHAAALLASLAGPDADRAVLVYAARAERRVLIMAGPAARGALDLASIGLCADALKMLMAADRTETALTDAIGQLERAGR